jgi:hypothetical protein
VEGVRQSKNEGVERGMIVGEASLLGGERCEEREEELFCARRRRSSESVEAPGPFVMLIVVSCGDGERWRTKLDLDSRKPFDDHHRAATVGAEPNVVRVGVH